MKRFKQIDKKACINSALGREPFDLVIKNGTILNVITGEIYPGEIGIKGPHIAYVKIDPEKLNRDVEEMVGLNYYDAKGKYIIPGLIDSHIHIESTMLTPRRFAELVAPTGTTTVIADPHEIANVYGVEGVKYMHDSSKDLPMRQIFLAPSCVPATLHLETNGASLFLDEIEELLDLERVIGLGEVMDYPDILNCGDRMMSILSLENNRDLLIQGHSPMLHTRKLAAYLCAGANTDHEATTAQEAKDKMRAGMYIDAREGSISKNIKKILDGVKDFRYLDTLTLCTDDREVDEIIKHGHMTGIVNNAIKYGMNPIDAIRAATFNTAREIGYRDIGAIAPGFLADMIITNSLENIKADAVFFEGKLIGESGNLLSQIDFKDIEIETKNSINIGELSLDMFEVDLPIINGELEFNIINCSDEDPIITNLHKEKLKISNGKIDISDRNDLKFIAVINRYGKSENYSVGIIKNFGIEKGAVATTVSNDSHNLTIVYSTPEEALLAAETIKKSGGGTCVILKDKVLKFLQLEVAGLMTNRNGNEVAKDINEIHEAVKVLGFKKEDEPFLKLIFLALPVIPEIRITDLGIVNVNTQSFIPLFNIGK